MLQDEVRVCAERKLGKKLEETELRKVNTVYKGWLIKGERISGVFPLSRVDELADEGFSSEEIADQVVELLTNIPINVKSVSIPETLEEIKPHLFVRISDMMRNESFLSEVPYREVAPGIAMTIHYLLSSSFENVMSFPVSRKQLSVWRIDEEDLWRAAMENAPQLFPRKIINFFNIEKARVVTDSVGINGAAALFYPGVLEEVADALETDEGFYIVPSSICEVLCFAELQPELKDCLNTINKNRSLVAETQVLSDDIFYYDRKRSRVDIAFTN